MGMGVNNVGGGQQQQPTAPEEGQRSHGKRVSIEENRAKSEQKNNEVMKVQENEAKDIDNKADQANAAASKAGPWGMLVGGIIKTVGNVMSGRKRHDSVGNVALKTVSAGMVKGQDIKGAQKAEDAKAAQDAKDTKDANNAQDKDAQDKPPPGNHAVGTLEVHHKVDMGQMTQKGPN